MLLPEQPDIVQRDVIRTWIQLGLFLMVTVVFMDWLIRRIALQETGKEIVR